MRYRHLAITIMLFFGCTPPAVETPPPGYKVIYSRIGVKIFVINHEGHDYIVVDGSGKAIVHSESCPCWSDPDGIPSKTKPAMPVGEVRTM